jgi:hypothetical protein
MVREEEIRQSRRIIYAWLRTFWLAALVIVLAAGGIIFLFVNATSGAVQLLGTLGTAVVGMVSLTGLTSKTARSSLDLEEAQLINALAWGNTYLPSFPVPSRTSIWLSFLRPKRHVPDDHERNDGQLGQEPDSS